MTSPLTASLSSKLAATDAVGFALTQSREQNYHYEWHKHDCAMLLWAQTGALDCQWLDGERLNSREPFVPHARRIVRNTALLLPPYAAHSTRSNTLRQRHGELYLRSELLRGRTRWGAFRLDGASLAILDALAAPALAPTCIEPLVHVLVTQLAVRDPAQWLDAQVSNCDITSEQLSRRMMHSFVRALEQERSLPAVEAVAEELGVSVRRLQRACAAALGVSPVAVRRRLLATRARELLEQGLTPACAAQRLGFTHSGHLNRLLRDVAG